jgi:hypothetical protein
MELDELFSTTATSMMANTVLTNAMEREFMLGTTVASTTVAFIQTAVKAKDW